MNSNLKRVFFIFLSVLCVVTVWKCVIDSFASISKAEASGRNILFIGDSRFVGMEYTVEESENINFLAVSGESHDLYFSNRAEIKNYPRNTIIFYNLGVNGLDSEGCVQALQDLKELGFENVYFAAVGPVDEELEWENGYSTRNEDIEEFNWYVRKNLPAGVKYIDSYGFLVNSGFETYDGLHYAGETYHKWFLELIGKVWHLRALA